mmetsp:Transcript_37748/g.90259  ORF Transcript_37748/g.90259 Transcript_37748/m.90259 type:complete len:328 (+) Transcript_37748:827-1810(+)
MRPLKPSRDYAVRHFWISFSHIGRMRPVFGKRPHRFQQILFSDIYREQREAVLDSLEHQAIRSVKYKVEVAVQRLHWTWLSADHHHIHLAESGAELQGILLAPQAQGQPQALDEGLRQIKPFRALHSQGAVAVEPFRELGHTALKKLRAHQALHHAVRSGSLGGYVHLQPVIGGEVQGNSRLAQHAVQDAPLARVRAVQVGFQRVNDQRIVQIIGLLQVLLDILPRNGCRHHGHPRSIFDFNIHFVGSTLVASPTLALALDPVLMGELAILLLHLCECSAHAFRNEACHEWPYIFQEDLVHVPVRIDQVVHKGLHSTTFAKLHRNLR